MKLQGKVIELASGSSYVDKTPRARIKINDAESVSFDSFYIVNTDGLELDQEVTIHVAPVVREGRLTRAAS